MTQRESAPRPVQLRCTATSNQLRVFTVSVAVGFRQGMTGTTRSDKYIRPVGTDPSVGVMSQEIM